MFGMKNVHIIHGPVATHYYGTCLFPGDGDSSKCYFFTNKLTYTLVGIVNDGDSLCFCTLGDFNCDGVEVSYI